MASCGCRPRRMPSRRPSRRGSEPLLRSQRRLSRRALSLVMCVVNSGGHSVLRRVGRRSGEAVLGQATDVRRRNGCGHVAHVTSRRCAKRPRRRCRRGRRWGDRAPSERSGSSAPCRRCRGSHRGRDRAAPLFARRARVRLHDQQGGGAATPRREGPLRSRRVPATDRSRPSWRATGQRALTSLTSGRRPRRWCMCPGRGLATRARGRVSKPCSSS
jgi:hypothetical protein